MGVGSHPGGPKAPDALLGGFDQKVLRGVKGLNGPPGAAAGQAGLGGARGAYARVVRRRYQQTAGVARVPGKLASRWPAASRRGAWQQRAGVALASALLLH